MKIKNLHYLMRFLLPAALLITSCASGAAASGTSAAASTIRTSSAQEDSSAPQAAAQADTPDYPDPYAMETFDTVPARLLERRDDVDYGTLDADVE